MKTLYLVRHAKSSWKHPELEDHERPLLEKGKKRTRKIIEFLLEKNITVSYMISSPAVRSYETARYIAAAFGYPLEKIKLSPHLYYGNHSSMLSIIQAIPDAFTNVMVIGHNPSITNFVNRFFTPSMDYLPTSGVICIQFDTDHWGKIAEAATHLGFIVYPRMIRPSKSESSFEVHRSAIAV